MIHPRSYLFVPGHRPDRFARAAASGAHRIIIDLEDAVAPGDKDAARENALQWFAGGGTGVLRVNGSDSPWYSADLEAVTRCASLVVMVPKADAASMRDVSRRIPGCPLIAVIETVAGLLEIKDVALSPGVGRLAFGNLDFGVDARIPGQGAVLDPARFAIVLQSRHAGLPPPIDGVTVAIDDEEGLRRDVAAARSLGFTAKLCIHPRQVETVNRGLAPSPAQIDWARTIVDAVSRGGGATVQIDGKMVDKPVVDRARAILAEGGA